MRRRFRVAVAGNRPASCRREPRMNYDTFVDQVARRVRTDPERAVVLVHATLATLAERLTGGEVLDLATQLPAPLRLALRPSPSTEAADRFGAAEFVARVGAAGRPGRTGRPGRRAGGLRHGPRGGQRRRVRRSGDPVSPRLPGSGGAGAHPGGVRAAPGLTAGHRIGPPTRDTQPLTRATTPPQWCALTWRVVRTWPNLDRTRGVLPTNHSGQYGVPRARLGWLPTANVGEGDLEHGTVFEEVP